ncbi:MAG: DUF87 domain-containing protein [Clostridia bacterium]|nr:DUF87 domain-containing protein [Clostridia bacterium]
MKEILPRYINNEIRYLQIDDKYILTLIIIDYPKYSEFLEIIESFPKNIEYDLSIYIDKQDTAQVLKEITQNISLTLSEIKTISRNQLDIDILNKTQDDAKKLRHEIQINNEEIYNIHVFLTIYCEGSCSKEYIINKLRKLESHLYSKQIIAYPTNFRQLDSYLKTLPLAANVRSFKEFGYRNFTTSLLANMFPFYTTSIFDINGVIFGKSVEENKLFHVDVFDSKYNNANMCIFGSSGSGKSYFTKLNIIRQHMRGTSQYIFDPENEYENIINRLGGEYIKYGENSSKFINIFDINEFEIYKYKNNLYDMKIMSIVEFLNDLGEFTDYQKVILKEAICNAYCKFDINKNVDSVYEICDNNNIYVDKKYKTTPILEDVRKELINLLKKSKFQKVNSNIENIEHTLDIFERKIMNKYEFLNHKTNIDVKNKLVCFSMYNLDNDIGGKIIKYTIENIENKLKYFKDNGKEKEQKTIIYIDEVWKYIGQASNNMFSNTLFRVYKTIRKLNGSIVTVTQDIVDLFKHENGIYGKSIINNSNFKFFFKLEYLEFEFLKNMGEINVLNIDNIMRLNKGQAILSLNNSNIKINIKASKLENSLIQGGIDEYCNCNG